MRNNKQSHVNMLEKKKITLHQLRVEFSAYTQSKAAIAILQNRDLHKPVHKVSAQISQLLQINQQQVVTLLAEDKASTEKKITNELYDECMFGRMKITNGISTYEQIIAALDPTNTTTTIATVLQIHAIFIHRIYDHLTIKTIDDVTNKSLKQQKQTIKELLFTPHLFSNRGRINNGIKDKINEEKKLRLIANTTYAGINSNHFFINKIRFRATVSPHLRARDCFTQDESMKKTAEEKGQIIPFVAGASGHTGTLLLGAKLYGNLNETELKDYTLNVFAFLTAGGNHSYQEVMVVAKQLGITEHSAEYLNKLAGQENVSANHCPII